MIKMEDKLKITISGNIFGTSGYASHVRGIANSLNEICDVKLNTPLFANWEHNVNDKELLMIQKEDSYDRINIIVDLPFNWNNHARYKTNIAYLIWEGDRIPKSFEDNIINPKIKYVFVPSQHVKDAILKNFKQYGKVSIEQINNKVKIIPHGFDPNIFNPTDKKNHMFTFFANKGFRNELDRGGIQYLLKAFIEEFNKGEARLVIKLNSAYMMSPQELDIIIRKYISQSNKDSTKLPEIMIIPDNIPVQKLAELYNEASVFVSPSEAEAFSMPCLESMACGVPVITTNYGGQLDFVNESNGWLINYKLHEIKHEIMYEGVSWARPSIEHLKQLMRHCLNNPEEVKQKGLKALEDSKNWTWNLSAKKIMGVL